MAQIKKPTVSFKSSSRPSAVKATKKAVKGAVALSKANSLAKDPNSEADMDKAFALRNFAKKSAKNMSVLGSSKSPNKLNDVMKKRIRQSKNARGK